ncbi:MAG: hypothetical protein L0H53_14405 [Candidatus Nitrosocosmicus sp.]|nr:hypothetical protein [Candidatus Nitrosocosmicus sp.]
MQKPGRWRNKDTGNAQINRLFRGTRLDEIINKLIGRYGLIYFIFSNYTFKLGKEIKYVRVIRTIFNPIHLDLG